MTKAERNYRHDSLKEELNNALEMSLSAVFDSYGNDTLKTPKRSLIIQRAFCLLRGSERSALVT